MTNTPFTLQNAEILMWCYFIVNSIKIISINKLDMFFPFPFLWTLISYILGKFFVSLTPIYYDMFSEIFIPFYHIALIILISIDILDIFPNNIEIFEHFEDAKKNINKDFNKINEEPLKKSDDSYSLKIKKSIAENKYYISENKYYISED